MMPEEGALTHEPQPKGEKEKNINPTPGPSVSKKEEKVVDWNKLTVWKKRNMASDHLTNAGFIVLKPNHGLTIIKPNNDKNKLKEAEDIVRKITATARNNLANDLKSKYPEHSKKNNQIDTAPFSFVSGDRIFMALQTPPTTVSRPCVLFNASLEKDAKCRLPSGHVDPETGIKELHVCYLCFSELSGVKSGHPAISCPMATAKHLSTPQRQWSQLLQVIN